MNLTAPADITGAQKLQALGLIEAAVAPPSKSRHDYGTIELVVVKRITLAGRAALGLQG